MISITIWTMFWWHSEMLLRHDIAQWLLSAPARIAFRGSPAKSSAVVRDDSTSCWCFVDTLLD